MSIDFILNSKITFFSSPRYFSRNRLNEILAICTYDVYGCPFSAYIIYAYLLHSIHTKVTTNNIFLFYIFTFITFLYRSDNIFFFLSRFLLCGSPAMSQPYRPRPKSLSALEIYLERITKSITTLACFFLVYVNTTS